MMATVHFKVTEWFRRNFVFPTFCVDRSFVVETKPILVLFSKARISFVFCLPVLVRPFRFFAFIMFNVFELGRRLLKTLWSKTLKNRNAMQKQRRKQASGETALVKSSFDSFDQREDATKVAGHNKASLKKTQHQEISNFERGVFFVVWSYRGGWKNLS